MKTRCALLPFVAGVAGAAAAGVGPSEEPTVQVGAVSMMEYGRYEASGALAQSPYRSLGGQGFGQVDLNAAWRPSASRLLGFQLRAVANDSDYRSPYDGIVIERASLRWEDGASALPWLLEGGDTFTYFSYRSLFRPLKGVQLELQPSLGGDRLSSLQFVVGGRGGSWRDFDLDDDLSAGASWLVEDARLGRLSLNYVHHYVHHERATKASSGDEADVTQDVVTLAAEKSLDLGSERLRLEGEVGRLNGEPAPSTAPRPAPEHGDPGRTGLFLQLSGRGRSPLSYRLRYESYGASFQPAGGSIYADRRSAEAHAALALGRGAELRARVQRFRDFRESVNPADTTVYGLAYSGRLPGQALGKIATSAEAFVQDLVSRDRALDAQLWTIHLDAYGSGALGFTPRLGFYFQDRDDHTVRDADNRTTQIRLGGDRPFRIGALRGTFSPGLLIRSQRFGADATNDLQPTLALPLASGRHSLYQSLTYLSQDRKTANAIDVDTLVYRMVYRCQLGPDALSFEIDTQDRRPDGSEDTRSLRAVVAWTHRLEHRSQPRPVALTPSTSATRTIDLVNLMPGSSIDAIRERLLDGGLGSGNRIGDLTIYEARLLPALEERQRLILVAADDRLTKAVLLIEAGADGVTLERTYSRAREALVERYGRPASFHEEGGFTADLAGALAHGDFARISEWQLDGATLRFGIPRRLDGQLRLELQIAKEFPGYGDSLWSVEEAR